MVQLLAARPYSITNPFVTRLFPSEGSFKDSMAVLGAPHLRPLTMPQEVTMVWRAQKTSVASPSTVASVGARFTLLHDRGQHFMIFSPQIKVRIGLHLKAVISYACGTRCLRAASF